MIMADSLVDTDTAILGTALVRTGKLVTVFGGSGFVGRHVVKALADRGWRVRVAARRPNLAFALQPSGRVGQIHAVQANLRYPDSVARAMRDADAVVNLVGLLAQGGPQTFAAIHAEGARTIALAAKAAGITNVVQMSAIGADPASSSDYGRTKAQAEAAVLEAIPQAVIVRPSVVFGPEDKFFNRFAAMARVMPALPLIGGGTGLLQPVFVGDVAEAIALAIDGKARPGTIYELGGAEARPFKDIMAFILKTIGRKRMLLPLSFSAAEAMGGVTEDDQEGDVRIDAGDARYDAGPSRVAKARQCRVRRRNCRGANASGPRHHAGILRKLRADLPLPLSQDRTICRSAARLTDLSRNAVTRETGADERGGPRRTI